MSKRPRKETIEISDDDAEATTSTHSKPKRKRIAKESSVKNTKDNVQEECSIWDIPTALAEVNSIPQNVAKNIINLIDDDNTLPFIARYRKSLVNYMSPERLQEVFDSYTELCKVKRKSMHIIKTMESTNQLTADIKTSIMSAKSTSEIDLLYEPYKVQNNSAKKQMASKLTNVARAVMNGERVNFKDHCDSSMPTPDDVKTNLIHSLAREIHKDPTVLETIQQLKSKADITIECKKARKMNSSSKKPPQTKKDNKENLEEKFSLYMNFKMRIHQIKSHQILAINRAEELKVISVKVVIPDWVQNQLQRFCRNKWKNCILITEVVEDAYKSFIQPWIGRQVRKDLTARASKESLGVFCSNLKRLLLTSPMKGKNILGIDPGFKFGCKVAAISSTGDAVETFVVHPDFNNANDPEGRKILTCLKENRCQVIALGNGKACRETEQWLRRIGVLKISSLLIVPEEGVSIYSCSPDASKEFSGMDPNLISAISLARRALDPLSELVKVNPKNMGVGMYQHDLAPKLLEEALNNVIVNCVSFVGADINTASFPVLRKIAGLTDKKVNNIIAYRSKHSGFKSRQEILKVTGIGEKTYEQCAGFLRVPNGETKLDNTWIHPENYTLARKFLKNINLNESDIGSVNFIEKFTSKIANVNIPREASNLKCSDSDLELIIDALKRPPAEDTLRVIKPVYSSAVVDSKELKEGTTLTGVVRNVTTFGVFVDCGLNNYGLIHKSKMGNSPQPHLGQTVSVSVLPSVTEGKISLQLIKILE